MSEQEPSNPNPYDLDLMRYWYAAIQRHGGDVAPDSPDPDEVDAFLGLFLEAPKKASSEDILLANRVHMHLLGATYREISAAESEEGYAAVGKTAIQSAVFERVPAIVAEQLRVIEGSDPRYRVADIFR